jgi:hypothetical protein
LPDGPTMTTGLSGKAAGRGGSPLERTRLTRGEVLVEGLGLSGDGTAT